LSQLFDSLQRHRESAPCERTPDRAARAARADAVLATLGYQRTRAQSRAALLVLLAAAVLALGVAWLLWPDTASL
jgi:hypothetical protein